MNNKLYITLKKELETDFWTIMNREKRRDINFFLIVLNEFLDVKEVNLKEVADLAKSLRLAYKETISEIYDFIEIEFGNVLKIMKDLKQTFKKKVVPIIKEINRKKWIRKKL